MEFRLFDDALSVAQVKLVAAEQPRNLRSYWERKVVSYRRFGTTCRSHHQGTSSPAQISFTPQITHTTIRLMGSCRGLFDIYLERLKELTGPLSLDRQYSNRTPPDFKCGRLAVHWFELNLKYQLF